MIRFHYLNQKLYHIFDRSTFTLVSVSIVLFMVVTLTAIISTSSDAFRFPLENVGGDIVLQLSGDILKKPEGVFSPPPTGYLSADAVERIRKLPVVILTKGAVFLWDLTLKILQKSMV